MGTINDFQVPDKMDLYQKKLLKSKKQEKEIQKKSIITEHKEIREQQKVQSLPPIKDHPPPTKDHPPPTKDLKESSIVTKLQTILTQERPTEIVEHIPKSVSEIRNTLTQQIMDTKPPLDIRKEYIEKQNIYSKPFLVNDLVQHMRQRIQQKLVKQEEQKTQELTQLLKYKLQNEKLSITEEERRKIWKDHIKRIQQQDVKLDTLWKDIFL